MTEYARPVIGGFYKHFKNKLYQVLHIAVHADTEEELVIYQALYGDFKIYARPLKDFMSEVDRNKYPDVKQKMRFVKVTLKKAEEPAAAVEVKADRETAEQAPKTDSEKASEAFSGMIAEMKKEAKAEPVSKQSYEELPEGVHPMLMRFLDAETVEARLKIFAEMEEIIDSHMLNAIAASLDISLGDDMSVMDGYSLIYDTLVTQKKYECSRWR